MKNKNWAKFQSVQNSLTGKCNPIFSSFSVDMGTMNIKQIKTLTRLLKILRLFNPKNLVIFPRVATKWIGFRIWNARCRWIYLALSSSPLEFIFKQIVDLFTLITSVRREVQIFQKGREIIDLAHMCKMGIIRCVPRIVHNHNANNNTSGYRSTCKMGPWFPLFLTFPTFLSHFQHFSVF